MHITDKLLIDATGCAPANAGLYAAHLDEACQRYEINTPERLACLYDVSPRKAGIYAPDLRLRNTDHASNVALHKSLTQQGPNRPDSIIVKLGSRNVYASPKRLWVLYSAILVTARSCWNKCVDYVSRMSYVINVRHVLQICKAVIQFVAVLVVDRHLLRARPQERLTNKSVHEKRLSGASKRQADVQVSMMVFCGSKHPGSCVISVASTHAAKVGNLVSSLVPNNWKPLANGFLHA